MKILKLFFSIVVLSLCIANSPLLKAADEDSVVDDDLIIEDIPEKGFLKSLMFWKDDDNFDDINEEITDEELDPRLARERAKPTEIRIRDKYALKVDLLKFFEANIKVTEGATLNKDTEFVVPLDEIEREIYIEEYYDREAPVFMSHLDIKQSVDSYKDKYFNNFKSLARIKVIYSNITENEVKGYGAYIGANLIIMQKLFEPTIGKFVYDIMFLTGDTKDKNLYWYRNSLEAEPLNKSLEKLNITNLNDYMNIITQKLLNPNRKVYQKISANYELEKEKKEKEEEAEEDNEEAKKFIKPGTTVDRRLEGLAVKANQALQNNNNETANENSSYLLNDLTEEELYELQKSLVTFRVNAVLGYWEDVVSGDIIEIRTIPKKGQKDITYVGYLISDEDLDKVVRYTEPSEEDEISDEEDVKNSSDNNSNTDTGRQSYFDTSNIVDPIDSVISDPKTSKKMSAEDTLLFGDETALTLKDLSNLKINKGLAWISQDLKMQFSSKGGSGIYIDEEKMVEDAKIFFHQAKGLIVVALPNNQYKYYKPIIPDIYPALEDALYNKMNIKDTDVDQNQISRFDQELPSTPGTTNYLLYPGITLGVIVAFLLIMM